MRKIILFVILIAAMVALAQEKTSLVVKDSSTATGVVIVTGVMGAQSVELQCNQNSPSCVPLKSGKYIMVVLAKNHGMYDCKNADVYPETSNPDSDEKIGEYCLTEK